MQILSLIYLLTLVPPALISNGPIGGRLIVGGLWLMIMNTIGIKISVKPVYKWIVAGFLVAAMGLYSCDLLTVGNGAILVITTIYWLWMVKIRYNT